MFPNSVFSPIYVMSFGLAFSEKVTTLFKLLYPLFCFLPGPKLE